MSHRQRSWFSSSSSCMVLGLRYCVSSCRRIIAFTNRLLILTDSPPQSIASVIVASADSTTELWPLDLIQTACSILYTTLRCYTDAHRKRKKHWFTKLLFVLLGGLSASTLSQDNATWRSVWRLSRDLDCLGCDVDSWFSIIRWRRVCIAWPSTSGSNSAP